LQQAGHARQFKIDRGCRTVGSRISNKSQSWPPGILEADNEKGHGPRDPASPEAEALTNQMAEL
jgi:hypothetical protein